MCLGRWRTGNRGDTEFSLFTGLKIPRLIPAATTSPTTRLPLANDVIVPQPAARRPPQFLVAVNADRAAGLCGAVVQRRQVQIIHTQGLGNGLAAGQAEAVAQAFVRAMRGPALHMHSQQG